jgi:hypothetical protein
MQIGEPKRIYRVEPLRAPVPKEPKQLPRPAEPEPQLKPAAMR